MRYKAILKLIKNPIAQGLQLLRGKKQGNKDYKQILENLRECKAAHTAANSTIIWTWQEVQLGPEAKESNSRSQLIGLAYLHSNLTPATKAIFDEIRSQLSTSVREIKPLAYDHPQELARAQTVALALEEKAQIDEAIRRSQQDCVPSAAGDDYIGSLAAEGGGAGAAPPRPSGSPHHCGSAAYGGEAYGGSAAYGGAGAKEEDAEAEAEDRASKAFGGHTRL